MLGVRLTACAGVRVYVAGIQDLSGTDLYGTSPGGASYGGHLRAPPLPSQAAMLLPGHPHPAMMMAHGGHMAHHAGMYGLPTMQGPTPLHSGVDSMGHVQDIHAR